MCRVRLREATVDRRWNLARRKSWDGRKDRYGSGSGLILFKLVVPLIESGMVRSYPIRDAWFLSRLLLEGIKLYPNFLGCNRWPMIPEVQDPNSMRSGHTSSCTVITSVLHSALWQGKLRQSLSSSHIYVPFAMRAWPFPHSDPATARVCLTTSRSPSFYVLSAY
jgi:hypothetical protein